MMSFRSCFMIQQIMHRLCKLIRKEEYLGPMNILGLWLGVKTSVALVLCNITSTLNQRLMKAIFETE